ncbi:MAG: hypothetical protein RIG61_04870 [Deltaproteobacteria bacterium]
MNKVEIRPRFTLSVPYGKQEAIRRLKNELQEPDSECRGKFVKPVVVIGVRKEDLHFWSPELGLEFEEEDGDTVIRCVLGPRPVVWTMFAAFYGLAVLLGLAGLILGLCQWYLGMNAYGFWLVPASVVLLAAAYGLALAGQKLAYDQMVMLRSCLEHAVGTD